MSSMEPAEIESKRSILLGYFTGRTEANEVDIVFTRATEAIEDASNGEISRQIRRWRSNLSAPVQQIMLLSNIQNNLPLDLATAEEVSVVDLGPFEADEEDGINRKLANIRKNIKRSCSVLSQNISVGAIEIDPCGYPTVVAESAVYGVFHRNRIESSLPKDSFYFEADVRPLPVSIRPLLQKTISDSTPESLEAFEEGLIVGECQNFARLLHGAGFYITPEEFTEHAKRELSCLENIRLIQRDEAWMEAMGMKSISQVTSVNTMCNDRGRHYSSFRRPHALMEIHYDGNQGTCPPVLLVGKASFYHPSESYFMTENKQPVHLIQNVSAGASIIAAILALARLKVPINVKGIVPVCVHSFCWRKFLDKEDALVERDIFCEVPDSREERLLLKDAVQYSSFAFEPRMMITVASQTSYLTEAFDSSTSVIYSSDDATAESFLQVCSDTGERFIRLPFVDIEDDIFEECIVKKQFCDDCRHILNGPVPQETKMDLIEYFSKNWDFCFLTSTCLKTMLRDKRWLHLELNKDLLVHKDEDDEVYELHSITGSPTRSFIYFLQCLSKEG